MEKSGHGRVQARECRCEPSRRSFQRYLAVSTLRRHEVYTGKTRLDLVIEAAAGECVAECGGRWMAAACEVLPAYGTQTQIEE